MKRILALSLLAVLMLHLAGCSLLEFGKRAEAEPLQENHTVLRTLEDGSTTYYCWENGIVTTSEAYREDSALYWENDIDLGAYVVKNSMGTVFASYYTQSAQAETTAESETAESTYDPYQGHTLEGIVTDPDMGNTYYCWDDGTVTTQEAYGSSGLTWTHPWGENFFNIYNGHSDNGNVIYSEKTCNWCGSHETFYLSYIRSDYDFTQITEYLCESCHVDLTTSYDKCCKCGCYYYKGSSVYHDGNYYCEMCYFDIP